MKEVTIMTVDSMNMRAPDSGKVSFVSPPKCTAKHLALHGHSVIIN